MFFQSSLQYILEAFKSLILRVNPIAFVSNRQMVSHLQGIYGTENVISNTSEAIYNNSSDSMLLMNGDAIIESVNVSTTTIFGFTPERMLGQHLDIIFDPNNVQNIQLFRTIDLMKSGQAGLIYMSNLAGIKDDEKTFPVKGTLLGISSNNRTAESFILICKDLTVEVQQKLDIEEAKHKSEAILQQILPKDIIIQLNRGATDISFSVPCATVIFIDIVKFSSYMQNLESNQIMDNLSKIFGAYDRILADYPLITKIKYIGDDFMAAAGLFQPDLNPEVHANDTLQFALRVLQAIDELNVELQANLQVRIGVNTNGPVFAGVLGTEKPLFDIIGDPINVTARLQTADIPGFVQISEPTYELVANRGFKIEKRGEIELKGKGKQMTFIVYPQHKEATIPETLKE